MSNPCSDEPSEMNFSQVKIDPCQFLNDLPNSPEAVGKGTNSFNPSSDQPLSSSFNKADPTEFFKNISMAASNDPLMIDFLLRALEMYKSAHRGSNLPESKLPIAKDITDCNANIDTHEVVNLVINQKSENAFVNPVRVIRTKNNTNVKPKSSEMTELPVNKLSERNNVNLSISKCRKKETVVNAERENGCNITFNNKKM